MTERPAGGAVTDRGVEESSRRSHSFGVPWESSYGYTQAIQAGRLCTSPANCPKTCTPNSLATRISSFRYTQPSAMSTGFLTHSTHVVQTTEYARDLPRHFE